MIFVNAISKTRYDKMHKKISNKIHLDIMMYLRLHSRYIISELFNKKLSHQRMSSFKVIEAIEKSCQVFRLELSSTMKIHSVISMTQLESAIIERDSYNRFTVMKLSSITDEHQDIEASFYKIERLLNKRITRDKIYYLIK